MKKQVSMKELERVCLTLLDSASKSILTITNYEEKIKEEVNQVKKFANDKTSDWIETSQELSQIFEFDKVSCLSNVGDTGTRKLEQAGITKLFQLAVIGKMQLN